VTSKRQMRLDLRRCPCGRGESSSGRVECHLGTRKSALLRSLGRWQRPIAAGLHIGKAMFPASRLCAASRLVCCAVAITNLWPGALPFAPLVASRRAMSALFGRTSWKSTGFCCVHFSVWWLFCWTPENRPAWTRRFDGRLVGLRFVGTSNQRARCVLWNLTGSWENGLAAGRTEFLVRSGQYGAICAPVLPLCLNSTNLAALTGC
jgi:hypothetical protein